MACEENESSSIQKNIHDNMPPESILLQQQQEDFTEPSEHLMFQAIKKRQVPWFWNAWIPRNLQLDEKEKFHPRTLGMIAGSSERIEWPSVLETCGEEKTVIILGNVLIDWRSNWKLHKVSWHVCASQEEVQT